MSTKKGIIIGVTGIFGSGKSTVSELLVDCLDGLLLDADEISHEILDRSGEVIEIFNTNDRKKLAHIVFNDDEKRKKLESILHPLIRNRVESEIQKTSKKYIVYDAPLLIETGFPCDIIIVVSCEDKTRNMRLIEKGFSMNDINLRTKAQDLGKELKADFIIDNSGSIEDVKIQIKKIIKSICI